uniref:START domain-containing protein n=1 Tax=Globisporangium ultimum (strain ATCC 200006 / CBS 805.95 / DAOM BR144) TaxID=431595 RepID=K3WNU5_GLOUD
MSNAGGGDLATPHAQHADMLVDLSLADENFLDQALSLSYGDENSGGDMTTDASLVLKARDTAAATPTGPPSDEEFTISTSRTLFCGPKTPTQTAPSPGHDGNQSAAVSPVNPPLAVDAQGKTTSPSTAPQSISSEDDRKKRHNENERRRTNALKTRILNMRGELAALETQRERLKEKGAQMLAANSSETAEKNHKFLEIVASIDRLRSEQTLLKKQLQQWDMQNSTYQTTLSELNRSNSVKLLTDSGAAQQQQHTAHISGDEDEENVESAIYADDAPIFQKVLFSRPMARDDAIACVRSSFDEIMAFRNQKDFESIGGQVLGWRDKRILDSTSLQFMLAQKFDAVLPQELVYKTWHLLTTQHLYRRIQPRTAELKLLQRVDNDIVIVRLSVRSGSTDQVHQSILLISRARIDGGYLITYRSIPLSEGKRAFAESEGTYVSIFNWFMFLDAYSETGAGCCCEVTFGGKVKNRSADYLRYLMMEVVAGVVRWQTAVGHSKLRLTN